MAIKALNSIGGFSVGDTPANIILANGDITTINFTSNGVANLGNVGNVKITGGTGGYVLSTDGTGNLSWAATGSPTSIHNENSNVSIPLANSNIYINANSGTNQQWAFETTGNTVFPSTGTANLGNLVIANYANFTNNLVVQGNISNANNISVTNNITTNTANLTGNLTGTYANFANDVAISGNISNVNNISITLNVEGNTANFSGNIKSLNANLGNLATANYVNVSQQINGNVANFSGNLTAANANLGNLATANFVNVSSNINVTDTMQAGNVRTDNLLYANGNPWDLQEAAGANTEIQYNDGSNNFGASANFTYDYVNSNLTVVGNIIATGTFVGNIEGNITISAANTTVLFSDDGVASGTTGFTFDKSNNHVVIDGNLDVNYSINATNLTSGLELSGNTANFTGNINSALNANLGNLVTANFVDVASNVTTYNLTVNSEISGNTANFTGNINSALNANLGNLVTANFVKSAEIYNNSSNVRIDYNSNVTVSVDGYADILTVSTLGANVTGTLDVTSNVTAANANLGNLVIANYANFTNNLVVQGNISNANNISVTNNITTNTANLTGNLTGTYANFANDLVVQGNIANANNISVTNNITTNTANLTGNLTGTYANFANDLVVQGDIANANNISVTNNLTANVANITTVVNTGSIANGTSNIRLATNGNVTISSNSLSNVFTFSDMGANVIGYIEANGLVTAGGFVGSNLVSNVGILSLQAKQTGGNYNINLLAGGTGNIDVGTTYITSVKDPLNAQDAATKAYVDSVAQGLDIKASVQFATAAVLPAYTYNNGTSGVGATITANANGALTIDGGSPTATQRVLIKDETGGNDPYNGIYVVTDAGGVGTPFILTRATDFDNGSPSGEIPGAFTFVEQGSTNADSGWVCTTNNPVTVGTTPIAFTQFSSAGSYSANTSAGLVLIGTQFNAKVDGVTTTFIGGNIAVANSAVLITPNIGAATGTSLNLTGNLLAGNVNSNATVTAANVDVTANVLANNFSANSNITSNNATVNLALTGNTANFSGNVILNNLTVNLELAGNTANFTGNITTLNANLGNLVTANYVNVATQVNGNIANFSGNLTSLNANLGNLATANYVNIATQLNGNIANFSGNLTSLNANLGNLATANTVSVTNVNVGNSIITSQTTTTLSTGANQTIATFTVTGTSVVGVEFFVKGDEAAGSKYSVAMVQAVTDGVDVDYAIYGGVRLGGTTGSLAVNMTSAGGNTNINLQVTPSSSNSTVWTTQIRLV